MRVISMVDVKKGLTISSSIAEKEVLFCHFLSCNRPKLLNGNTVIAYNVGQNTVEIDTSTRFVSFTANDVAHAVIISDSELQLPSSKKHMNKVVTLTF